MSDAEPPEQPPPAVEPPALAPRRLHPAGAVLSVLDDVRNALFSLVVLIVLGSQSGRLGAVVVLAGVGGAAVATVVGWLRWRAETYAIADGAIRHRHGLVSPDETVVPLARVHSIDVAQGPVQRLFGVDELHVQTAGGGERGEIVLRAVGPAETALLRGAAGLPEPSVADLERWRLSPRGLLLVGLTAPQLGMLLPLVGGAIAIGNDLLGQGARDSLVDRLPTETATVVALVVAALAAAWLLSFLGSLVAFAGFSVTLDGDHLRIQRGFLERRATSVPLRRVHAISVAEGPLRRPLGLCSVRLETAGYGEEPAAARTLFPLLAVAELDRELARLVPPLAAAAPSADWQRPPRRALRRYLVGPAIAGVVVGAIATAIWTPAWPAIPVLTLLALLDGLARWRAAGWRQQGDRLALRHGALTRRTLIARATRLQDHSLAQDPVQRRVALADVSITVASGRTATVSELELGDATALFERLRPAAAPPGAA